MLNNRYENLVLEVHFRSFQIITTFDPGYAESLLQRRYFK